MADAFGGTLDSVSSPATRGVAVAPHDAEPLADVPKALFVGTGGSLTLRGVGGSGDVVFRNVPAGSVLPFRALFVRATGTSAADIVALY
jgi:outer membrane receptor protein involved in Fe transport